MNENRAPEERTNRTLALLDGMADLWWAQSGFAGQGWPEPIVRAVKQAHVEGLYAGRISHVDEVIERNRLLEECALAIEATFDDIGSPDEQNGTLAAAETVRDLKRAG